MADSLERAFTRNRQRREDAEAKLDAARRELAELLVRGKAEGRPVAEMARLAGISRETAHKLLRRTGDG